MKRVRSLQPNSAPLQALQIYKNTQQQNTPVEWSANRNIVLWSKQKEILEALRVHRRVAVRSCHDSGKSYVAALAATHHIATHRPGTARVVTTAPTSTQVKGILWVELNKHFNATTNSNHTPQNTADEELYQLPGRTNQTEWWIGTFLAGLGRKPSDYNPAGMQGLHAEFMLIIVDEASGVSSSLVDAVETLATNDDARVLMIGNPDDPNSQFAKIHADPAKYGYHTIKISAFDTPNFTEEHEHLPAYVNNSLLSKRWVEERKRAWGEDHPFYIAKVLGEFPIEAENQIAKASAIVAARVPFAERAERSGPTLPTTPALAIEKRWTALGVDVAGSENGDETVVREIEAFPRTGRVVVGREWKVRTTEPAEIQELVMLAQVMSKAAFIAVDTVGIGWGVRELIAQSMKLPNGQKRATTLSVNVAEHAENNVTYANRRAELWWVIAREMFAQGKIDTSQADNVEELEAQLLEPTYVIRKGKIQVEAKDEIRKRLSRSPDNADAFLLAIVPLLERHTLTIVTTPAAQLAERHTWNKVGPRMQQLKLVKARS